MPAAAPIPKRTVEALHPHPTGLPLSEENPFCCAQPRNRRGFKRLMRPLRNRVEALLLRGKFSGEPSITGMCNELYEHRDWLWNFVEVEGVEPTNNASERALRHAVIWRKLSFGTQSAAGSRFVETMLTVIETCRQQNRPVFQYLVEALEEHADGKQIPSLVSRP